jgi:hypothetical protein
LLQFSITGKNQEQAPGDPSRINAKLAVEDTPERYLAKV